MIFIKEGLIAKRLDAYEDICFEVTMSKRKWCVTFAYRSSYNSNKECFFKELNKSRTRSNIRNDTHMRPKKIVQFSRPPPPPLPQPPTISHHPVDLGRRISNDPPPPPPLSLNDNRSIKRKT